MVQYDIKSNMSIDICILLLILRVKQSEYLSRWSSMTLKAIGVLILAYCSLYYVYINRNIDVCILLLILRVNNMNIDLDILLHILRVKQYEYSSRHITLNITCYAIRNLISTICSEYFL